jgi:CMP-N-acetylneuraminic acid synthetase
VRLAVIGARGRGKRIPPMNIKPLADKAMVAQSMTVAQESVEFDRIIVSTSDSEIAGVSKDHDAEVMICHL